MWCANFDNFFEYFVLVKKVSWYRNNNLRQWFELLRTSTNDRRKIFLVGVQNFPRSYVEGYMGYAPANHTGYLVSIPLILGPPGNQEECMNSCLYPFFRFHPYFKNLSYYCTKSYVFLFILKLPGIQLTKNSMPLPGKYGKIYPSWFSTSLGQFFPNLPDNCMLFFVNCIPRNFKINKNT